MNMPKYKKSKCILAAVRPGPRAGQIPILMTFAYDWSQTWKPIGATRLLKHPTSAFKADLRAFWGLATGESDRYVFGNQ